MTSKCDKSQGGAAGNQTKRHHYVIEHEGVQVMEVHYNPQFVETFLTEVRRSVLHDLSTENRKNRRLLDEEQKRERKLPSVTPETMDKIPPYDILKESPSYIKYLEKASELLNNQPENLEQEVMERVVRINTFIEASLPVRLYFLAIQIAAEAMMSVSSDPTPSKDIEGVEKLFLPYATLMIPTSSPGGDTRSKHRWDDNDLHKFASEVEQLLPHWKWIKHFYKTHDYEDGWMSMLKEASNYKLVLQKYGAVPSDLLRRVADNKLDKREREPKALALEHARRILKIPKYGSESLRRKYEKGRKLKTPF